uniref:Uncharacterized protein n=1 Tax=Siphoviridae sp. ctZHD14 TaxID=2827891 RepID=A0A8S5SVZ0_9CAUD|nr:MAG TPA: hypothetical protein [Siphoviridae sp. ctZHD14]
MWHNNRCQEGMKNIPPSPKGKNKMVAFANMSNNQLADLDASLAAIRTVNKMRDCMSEAALSETVKRIAENAAARIGNGLNAEKLLRLAEVTE